jgi:CysZ protein
MSRFVSGLIVPLRGLSYLASHPTLAPLAALPALVNLVVWAGIVALILGRAGRLVDALVPASGWAHYLLYVPALVLAYLVVLVVAAVLVHFFGSLVAAPFNDLLSARVERLEGRQVDEEGGVLRALARFGGSLIDELKKWGLYVVCLVALAPLLLVPIAGQLAWPVASSLVTFWFLAYEYLDYPFSRRGFRFADRRAFCWTHFRPMVGMGISVTVTTFVPLVCFVLMPLSVVGGTLLYLDLEPAAGATQSSPPAP